MGSSQSNMNKRHMSKEELRKNVEELFKKSHDETTMRQFTPMNSLTSSVNVQTVVNEINQVQSGGSRVYSINPNNIPSRQRYSNDLLKNYEETKILGGANAEDTKYVQSMLYGNQEQMEATQTATDSFELTKPLEQTKSLGQTKPLEQTKPIEQTKPLEQTRQGEESVELTDTPQEPSLFDGFFNLFSGPTQVTKSKEKDVDGTISATSQYSETSPNEETTVVSASAVTASAVTASAEQKGGSIDTTLDQIQKLVNQVQMGGQDNMDNVDNVDDEAVQMKEMMDGVDGSIMDNELQKYMNDLQNEEPESMMGGGVRDSDDYEKSEFSGGDSDSDGDVNVSDDSTTGDSNGNDDSTTEGMNEEDDSTIDEDLEERMELSMAKRRNKENYLNRTVIKGRAIYSSASDVSSDMLNAMKHNDRLN